MNRYAYIVSIIALFVSFSCSKVEDNLNMAEELLSTRPDSALAILETMSPYSSLNQAEQARCGKLIAFAALYQKRSFALNTLLDESIKYYQSTNDTSNLCECYQLAAFRSRWRGNRDSAVFYTSKAIELIPCEKSDALSNLYLRISGYYSEPVAKKDYNKAIIFAQKAAEAAETDGILSLAYQNMAFCYSFVGKRDSALAYSYKSIETALSSNERPADFPTYVTNYANLDGADFDLSKNMLESLPKSYNVAKYITLGYMYLNKRNLDSASIYLNKASDIYKQNSNKLSINTGNNLSTLKTCLDFALHKPIFSSLNVTANDSINRVSQMQQALNEEITENNILLNRHLFLLQIGRQRLIIVLICILSVAVITFFIHDKKRKQKYIKLQKQLNNSRVQQILKEAEQEDNAISTPNEERLAILQKRVEICIESFKHSEWMKRIQIMEIQDSTHSQYLSIADRQKLNTALLESFTEFVIDLKSYGTNLTIDDIMLCLLNLLHIKNSTISLCTSNTESHIRTRKSRLKGKLPVEIFDFIFNTNRCN